MWRARTLAIALALLAGCGVATPPRPGRGPARKSQPPGAGPNARPPYATSVNPGSGIQFPSLAAGFALSGQPVNTLDGLLSAPDGVTVVWPSPSVLVSRDRGRSWQISLSTTGGLWGLDFADPMRGLAVGVKSLYRTDDAGRHWRLVREPSQPLVRAVFTGPYRVVGLSSAGRLVATSNEGLSWHRAKWAGRGDAVCSTGDEVLVADRDGGVWRSKDPNYPFTQVALGRARPIEYSEWWVDLSCAGESAVEFMQAFGEATDGGVKTVVRQSTDGGFTWRRIAEINFGAANAKAAFPSEAVAVADRRACVFSYPHSPTLDIRCTSDGGHSFEQARTPVVPRSQYPSLHLQGVDFLSPSLGWLLVVDSVVDGRKPARYQTQVWATNDGGGSWRIAYTSPMASVPAL